MKSYDTTWQGGSRKRRTQRVRWARLLAAPVAALVLLLLAWAVLLSPLLSVRAVTVTGAAHVDPSSVMDAARAAEAGFLRRTLTTGHLLGWPAELPPEAVALVPGAEAIAVKRGLLSRTVTLAVTERAPLGVWCFEGDPASQVCQWFDETGVAFSRAFVSQGSLVPVVHDKGQTKAGEGRRVLPAEELARFLAILGILKERAISPREVTLSSLSRAEVTMTTYNGPRLIFSLRAPPDHVPPVLDDFIKQGTLDSLGSIDFRSPKRAFYQ